MSWLSHMRSTAGLFFSSMSPHYRLPSQEASPPPPQVIPVLPSLGEVKEGVKVVAQLVDQTARTMTPLDAAEGSARSAAVSDKVDAAFAPLEQAVKGVEERVADLTAAVQQGLKNRRELGLSESSFAMVEPLAQPTQPVNAKDQNPTVKDRIGFAINGQGPVDLKNAAKVGLIATTALYAPLSSAVAVGAVLLNDQMPQEVTDAMVVATTALVTKSAAATAGALAAVSDTAVKLGWKAAKQVLPQGLGSAVDSGVGGVRQAVHFAQDVKAGYEVNRLMREFEEQPLEVSAQDTAADLPGLERWEQPAANRAYAMTAHFIDAKAKPAAVLAAKASAAAAVGLVASPMTAFVVGSALVNSKHADALLNAAVGYATNSTKVAVASALPGAKSAATKVAGYAWANARALLPGFMVR